MDLSNPNPYRAREYANMLTREYAKLRKIFKFWITAKEDRIFLELHLIAEHVALI